MLSKKSVEKITQPRLRKLIDPVYKHQLLKEVSLLPEKQLLLDNGKFQVFYARAQQIPNLLQEIGRLREASFREVGEGTGKPCDVDLYDQYYHQIFIWSPHTLEVVGGYRLGLSDEIRDHYKQKGLYTHSLFKISPQFFSHSAPAIELGRSFVRTEYQKNYAPLMLLWKGIAEFACRNPRYAVLYGPVSISNSYTTLSQQLLINYLKQNLMDSEFSAYVKPRTPVKNRLKKHLCMNDLRAMDIEQLSALISSLEEDEKGVPVLFRQYLKLNGKMLGFNLDPKFGDCIDGLIRVDLRNTSLKSLEKLMGSEQAEQYLNYHRQKGQPDQLLSLPLNIKNA